MKAITKGIGLCLALATLGVVGCKNKEDNGAGTSSIKLTVWVSEGDKPFATEVVKAFKAKNPEKNYNIVIDIQGENDVATRVLNDVESAADVFSCSNDQSINLSTATRLQKLRVRV